jgi:hypothetical protein
LADIPHGRWHKTGEPAGDLNIQHTVSFSAGASNRLECDEGYSLVGDEFLSCKEGQWDHPLPRCDSLSYKPTVCNCPAPSTSIPVTSWTKINFTSSYHFSEVIDIGFNFVFFGKTYSVLLVSPNGFITFDTACTTPQFPPGTVIPSSHILSKTIIAFWGTDLDVSGAEVAYATVGEPGNRKFVLSVSGITYANDTSTGTLSAEVSLWESDSHLEFYYHNAPAANSSVVTVGLQDTAGKVGAYALYNGEVPTAVNDVALEWRPVANKSGPNWLVIGLATGFSLVALALVAGCLYWRYKKHKQNQVRPAPQSMNVMQTQKPVDV